MTARVTSGLLDGQRTSAVQFGPFRRKPPQRCGPLDRPIIDALQRADLGQDLPVHCAMLEAQSQRGPSRG
jgi:hypothetical protein